MRVAIETNAQYVTQAGVARHTRGLLRGLRKALPPALQSWRELAWPVPNLSYQQPQRALKTFYREIVWAHFIAPRDLSRAPVDLLHATASILVPPPANVRATVALHDLAMVRHPERYRRWQGWSARKRLGRLKWMDKIICISRFTADEAMALLELPASKLEVVYNGCDFHPSETRPQESAPTGSTDLNMGFFLFVGSLEPGKNLALLEQVWRTAEEQGKPLPGLVIVGARWPGVRAESPPPKSWRYLGHVTDAELIWLYRNAVALLFPSRYEGFGLPVAEAMALECPVVASRTSSIPEVGGEAILYAELEPRSFLRASRRMLEDLDLREHYRCLGKERSELFAWERCARDTVEVWRKVCGA